MENLSEDITLNILSRSPAESVLWCKLVCKNWLRILRCNAAYFAGKHLHHQLMQLADHRANHGGADKLESGFGILYAMWCDKRLFKAILCFGNHGQERINIEDCFRVSKRAANDNSHLHYLSTMDSLLFRYGFLKLKTIDCGPFLTRDTDNDLVVGSCNGLVCINVLSRNGFEDPIYICNPFTREYIFLDRFHQECGSLDSMTMFTGFGYLPRTDVYKVVRILRRPGIEARQVQVYTLGDGTGWRNKGELNMAVEGFNSPGIFANGSLYWSVSSAREILAFDLADEVFRVIQSPAGLECISTTTLWSSLYLLGGCLVLCHQNIHRPLELWLYREKSDNSCAADGKKNYLWNKEYTIAAEAGIYEPFALTERGEILMWKDDMLLCYDPEKECLVKLASCFDTSKSCRKGQTVLHMNSFVSLKGMGEKFAEIGTTQSYQLWD